MKIIQVGYIYLNFQKKAAIITTNEIIIFNSLTIYSKPLVILENGRLCLIKKCKDNWCKIKTGKYKGWVKKEVLWGLL